MVQKPSSSVRQRPSKTASASKTKSTHQEDEQLEELDKYFGLHPLAYYTWQYSGAVLAVISLIGLVTSSYDEEDPWVVKRLFFYLFILLLALGAHESRPYQREFKMRWKSLEEFKRRGLDGSVKTLMQEEAAAAASASAGSGSKKGS